ncbi:hypothetical protein FDUTEX481_02490 [Tolypothrix sp. PCC 7601]|nr:hypothetical protein FDUTEX481_02490 [Tolypothrix sp. PCC 7601]
MSLSRCCVFHYSQLTLREFFYKLPDFSNNLLGAIQNLPKIKNPRGANP